MNGYQPEKKCTKCLAFNICNKKHKNQVCKKYKECRPAPPKTGSNSQTPTYTPPPMPEVKPAKQRTVLSVRDFAILYNVVIDNILRLEFDAERKAITYGIADLSTPYAVSECVDEAKRTQLLNEDYYYQDLLRIRDKLGELNIEVETPSVEVE